MGATAAWFSHWRVLRRRGGVLLVAVIGVGCQALDLLNHPEGLAIQRFTATPAEIMAGGSAVLSWDVEGADTVQIEGIGTVPPKGSRQVSPAWSTRYTLVARAGTSSATATLQVAVQTGLNPSPTPSISPTPSPSPSATPTPTPSPSPSPSSSPSPSPSPTPPTPTPSPTPTPTPVPVTCGDPAGPADTCAVTVSRPTSLPAGQCLELNRVTVSQSCPVGVTTVRSVSFRITARTNRSLQWRRSDQSSDVLDPASGGITGDGKTDVTVTEIVLGSTVTFEVVDGSAVLLRFAVRNY